MTVLPYEVLSLVRWLLPRFLVKTFNPRFFSIVSCMRCVFQLRRSRLKKLRIFLLRDWVSNKGFVISRRRRICSKVSSESLHFLSVYHFANCPSDPSKVFVHICRGFQCNKSILEFQLELNYPTWGTVGWRSDLFKLLFRVPLTIWWSLSIFNLLITETSLNMRFLSVIMKISFFTLASELLQVHFLWCFFLKRGSYRIAPACWESWLLFDLSGFYAHSDVVPNMIRRFPFPLCH